MPGPGHGAGDTGARSNDRNTLWRPVFLLPPDGVYDDSRMDTFHEPSQTETILESISDGVFTVDRKWRITSFNRAAEEITGVSREDAQGRLCSEIFRSSVCEGACALRETMATGKPVINRSCFIVTRSEERIPISVSTALLRNKQGAVIGGV